ncbi:MAG: hypothetical protein ACXVLQ_06500 [Bacteriovorax sp.]
MRLALIFVLALSLHILHAQDSSSNKDVSFAEKMRPTLMKIVGEKWTFKLIGAAPEEKMDEGVVLPAIPKISEDARSTAVYEKKQDKVVLKPELEQKYYYAYIKEIYEATRQLKPNDDEVAKMINVLAQGGSREGVYHSLVLDSSYGGMENYDKPVKSNAADFAVYFYGRYLGKKVSKESLKGMNAYTLKRLIADKSLDIIDAYGDKRDELESWYAVMSSDLASKFPQVWSSKLRKDTSSLHHKVWASKVPIQHIKSETLIKIHSAMNSMM